MSEQIILSYPSVYTVVQIVGALVGIVCISVIKKLGFDKKTTFLSGIFLAFLGSLTLTLTYNFFAPKTTINSFSFLKVFFGLNQYVLFSSFFISFSLPFVWEFLRKEK